MTFNPLNHGTPNGESYFCKTCGCAFKPRFLSSLNCDYCRTPAGSFLGLPDSTFYKLPPHAIGPTFPQSAAL